MRRSLYLFWLASLPTLAIEPPATPQVPAGMPQAVAPLTSQDTKQSPPPRCPGCRREGNLPPTDLAADADIKDPTAKGSARAMARDGMAGDIRDPTQEPKRFREAWRQMNPAGAAKGRAASAMVRIPEISVVGKSLGQGRTPMAVLQVDKQNFMVMQGSQFSLPTRNGDFINFKVESVSPAGVALLVLPSGERLMLY